MAQPPSFYLTGSTGGAYQTFIRELRRLVAHPGRFAHNVPALIEEDENRADNLIEVVLRTEEQAVRLSLRRDNLYLVGFRDNTPGSTWYELDNGRQWIPGSTPVGIRDRYGALEGAAGIGPQTRLAVILGRTPLSAAVNQLAALRNPAGDGNRQATAYSLLVVIQMVPESIRIQWITGYLVENWLTDLTTPGRMIEYETAWRTLSDALIHAGQDHEYEPFRLRLPNPNNFGITDPTGLAACLGILLHRGIAHYQGLLRTTRAIASPWDTYPHGRPMLEVLWVRIENIDGEKPGDLYGTITINDALDCLYLYNRGRDSPESIYPGQHATLLDLPRSILACDSFTINFDLIDKDFDPSPDDSIVKETIEWYPANAHNTWDQPITQRVSGPSGWATVEYIVLSNTAQATVQVILVNGDNEDPADIYGTIKARTGFGEFVIFDRSAGEHVDVSPNAPIPIDKSVFAVALSQHLEIDVSLFDHDDDPSFDDEIAKGIAKFDVDIMKSGAQSITGASGEISVRVTWL
ncbi:ribosome-inactivating protein [Xylaria arbuscula]|nr:ribosome-inactivating protein [Xylaria arbuscula]